MKIFGGPAPPPTDIDRGQDAPVHWNEMGSERDDHLPTGGERELLIKFGHVAVMTNTVSMKALRYFGEQHGLFGSAARGGHAGLGTNEDFVDLARLVFDERDERQLRACRVAAGIGDQPRMPDLAPVNFGQPVNCLLLQLRRMMVVAIPFRI